MRNAKRILITLVLAVPLAAFVGGAQALPGKNNGRSPQAGGLPATNARVTALENAVSALGAATSFASVEADATVTASKGVDTVEATGTGAYDVTFSGDVSSCAAVATAHNSGTPVLAMVSHSSATTVTVTTFNLSGTAVDNGFDLVVTCSS